MSSTISSRMVGEGGISISVVRALSSTQVDTVVVLFVIPSGVISFSTRTSHVERSLYVWLLCCSCF